jgi:hypothetical protein
MFIKIVTTIEAIESWFVVGIVGDRVLTTVEDGAKRRGRRWTMALTLVIMAVPLQRGGGNDAVPLYDWTTTTIKDLKVGNGHTMVPGLAKDVDRDQWHRKFHTREARYHRAYEDRQQRHYSWYSNESPRRRILANEHCIGQLEYTRSSPPPARIELGPPRVVSRKREKLSSRLKWMLSVYPLGLWRINSTRILIRLLKKSTHV